MDTQSSSRSIDSSFPHSLELDSQKEKDEEVSEAPHNHHGYNWMICAVLMVGITAGGGMVALPSSFVNSGLWAGIAMMMMSAVLSAYTAVQLGNNWIIMQERWPKYVESCRKPYPEMAFRALGNGVRNFVTFIVTLQQFGFSVVFLLLASNNISSFLYTFWQLKINFCFIALVVAVFIVPFLMLGSAKDFWQTAYVALCSTCAAASLMIVGIIHDWGPCRTDVDFPPVVFKKFFLAYGTIMFAFGGHSAFPTFQHDMKNPKDFHKSAISAYVLMLILYLPVSVLGYLVYGGSQGGSIITSLQLTWVQQTVNVLITVHVVFAQVLICSPISLQVEELCRLPNEFGIRRIILRASVVLCVLFTALSIPKFGAILDLIGSSTITLLSMILPSIFNLILVASTRKRKQVASDVEEETVNISVVDVFRHNSWPVLILNFCVLAFGVIGGVASTLSAINEIATTKWQLPCYVEMFKGTLNFEGDGGAVSCCGLFKNITTLDRVDPNGFCAALS